MDTNILYNYRKYSIMAFFYPKDGKVFYRYRFGFRGKEVSIGK